MLTLLRVDHLVDGGPLLGEPLQERESIGGIRRRRVVQPPRLVLGRIHERGCYEASIPIAAANAAHQSR
jgi:hypothetical protein